MPAKAEVIGEGNPFKIRVTMSGANISHTVAHEASIHRLPEGVWLLDDYKLDGSGDGVVAECHYRQASTEIFGPGPVEVVVVGDKEVKIIRLPKRPS